MRISLLGLETEEKSDIENLQAQIDVLRQNETELAKRPELGPDTIISIYLFGLMYRLCLDPKF